MPTCTTFDDDIIDLARRLKRLGLSWEPRPGHYVYDETGLIEPPSPFRERVYFILDLKHFLRRTGTLEELKARFTWLPTWEDARNLSADLGIANEETAERLRAARSVENRRELADLLQWIGEELERKTAGK